MSWSPQQEEAIRAVRAWIKQENAPQIFRLFGFAGTGKTTLAREIAGDIGKVVYGAFTGKAAMVLRTKGCANASTIHGLIYSPVDEENMGAPRWVLKHDSPVADANLVVIDECSMVDEKLAADLMSFGTKILVLGDPAQLPPVKGTGFFTNAKPDCMLTEVHRQARDNPIIRMSMTIREGGRLECGEYGECNVISRRQIGPERILAADQVLVGLNRTRHSYNGRIRELLGRKDSKPVAGDRLVGLRNDRTCNMLNGSLWNVEKIAKPRSKAKIEAPVIQMTVSPLDFAGGKHEIVHVREEFFLGTEGALPWEERRGTQEMTYGYALTVHKAQGSQWDDVVLFDEASTFREDSTRWLYTGVTRAAKRLTMVM